VGGPPGKDYPVDAEGSHGKDVENADIQVENRSCLVGKRSNLQRYLVTGYLDGVTKRDDGKRYKRRDKGNERCQDESKFACFCRDDLFLEEQFDPVSNRLEEAHRTGSVRSDTDLHPADDLTLSVGCVSNGQENEDKRDQDLENHGSEVHVPWVTSKYIHTILIPS